VRNCAHCGIEGAFRTSGAVSRAAEPRALSTMAPPENGVLSGSMPVGPLQVVGQHRFQEQHLLRRWPGPVRVRVERQQRFRRKHLLRQSHEPTDALGADPSLAAPGTGGDGFDSLSGHQLGTNSPRPARAGMASIRSPATSWERTRRAVAAASSSKTTADATSGATPCHRTRRRTWAHPRDRRPTRRTRSRSPIRALPGSQLSYRRQPSRHRPGGVEGHRLADKTRQPG
jgi:hypothetical protein